MQIPRALVLPSRLCYLPLATCLVRQAVWLILTQLPGKHVFSTEQEQEEKQGIMDQMIHVTYAWCFSKHLTTYKFTQPS